MSKELNQQVQYISVHIRGVHIRGVHIRGVHIHIRGVDKFGRVGGWDVVLSAYM